MMRVLFVPGYRYPRDLKEPITSGDLRYTFNVSRALARAGHSVEVLTRFEDGDAEQSELEGVRIYRYRSELGRILNTSFDISLRRASLFRRLMAEADVAFVNTPLTAELARRVTTPFCYVASGLEDVRNYGTTARELLGRLAIKAIRDPAKKLTWRRADFVNTTASGEKATLIRWGVSPDRVVSVGPSVELERYHPVPKEEERGLRRSLGLPMDQQLVLVVGRFTPAKGLLRTLAAFSTMRSAGVNAHLVIVGVEQSHSAGYLDSVYDRISTLRLEDAVTIAVDVPEASLPSYYASADVTSVFSEMYDPLPTVIIESMACATPVVSTRYDTRAQFIQDGVNGVFVEEGDIIGWRASIERLLTDESLAKRIAENSRLTAIERFDSNRVAESLLDLFRGSNGNGSEARSDQHGANHS